MVRVHEATSSSLVTPTKVKLSRVLVSANTVRAFVLFCMYIFIITDLAEFVKTFEQIFFDGIMSGMEGRGSAFPPLFIFSLSSLYLSLISLSYLFIYLYI